jgi:hypothetical protein
MISAVLFDLIKGLKVNHKHKTRTAISHKTKRQSKFHKTAVKKETVEPDMEKRTSKESSRSIWRDVLA